MATRKKTSKRSKNTSSNGNGTTRPEVAAAMRAASLRDRFEDRLDDVKVRFRSFEKDWSKTVNGLVNRGRSAERDLRKRLDKVSKDLKKTVNKNPALKKVANGGLLDAVRSTVGSATYDKAYKQIRKDVTGFQKDVGQFFQASASRVRSVIDRPSRTDFDRLNRKIAELSGQVRSLETKRKR